MIEYVWPECPWCCAQPESILNLSGTFAWQRTRCLKCDRPFELRMTARAAFEMRQVPEAVTS